MKLNIKRILALICVVIMAVCASAAATADKCLIEQTGDTEVSVSVTTDTGIITVAVRPDGRSLEELFEAEKANYGDIMVYNNEFTTENGKKDFVMDLGNSPTGTYTLILSENGETSEYTFEFERRDIKKNAYSDINKAETAKAVEEILSESYADMGVSEEDWKNVDAEDVAQAVYDYVKSGGVLDSEDEGESDKVIIRAVAISLLDNSKAENIYDYADAFGIKDIEAGKYYKESYVTEAVQKNITERMSGEGITEDTFGDEFTEALVLAVIEEADGYVNVKKIATAFEDEIGIDASDATDAVFGKLAGEDFEEYSDLKKKFNSLADNKNTSTGGSSGGGGGGGGGRANAYTPGENVKEPAKELPVSIFTDIDNVEWAKKSIISLAQKGIVNGKDGEHFCPDDNVTRYEFVKLAVLTFLDDAENGELPFEDVSAGHWAYEYVNKAYNAGIINGKSDKEFDGDGNITREEMAAIIHRTAKISGYVLSEYEEIKGAVFEDDADISDYAKEAVYVLKNDGIINGVGENVFAPKERATRAQAAHIINTLDER